MDAMGYRKKYSFNFYDHGPKWLSKNEFGSDFTNYTLNSGFQMLSSKHHLCQGRSTPCIGDGRSPTFNRESLFHGCINPYGLGLMSLSPMIWKCHGS